MEKASVDQELAEYRYGYRDYYNRLRKSGPIQYNYKFDRELDYSVYDYLVYMNLMTVIIWREVHYRINELIKLIQLLIVLVH